MRSSVRAPLLVLGLAGCVVLGAGGARAAEDDAEPRSAALFREGVSPPEQAGDYARAEGRLPGHPVGSCRRHPRCANWALSEMKLGKTGGKRSRTCRRSPSRWAVGRPTSGSSCARTLDDAYAATGHLSVKTRLGSAGDDRRRARPRGGAGSTRASRCHGGRAPGRGASGRRDGASRRGGGGWRPCVEVDLAIPRAPQGGACRRIREAERSPPTSARGPHASTDREDGGPRLAPWPPAWPARPRWESAWASTLRCRGSRRGVRRQRLARRALAGDCAAALAPPGCGALHDKINAAHVDETLEGVAFAAGAAAALGAAVEFALARPAAPVRTGAVRWTPLITPQAAGVAGSFGEAKEDHGEAFVDVAGPGPGLAGCSPRCRGLLRPENARVHGPRRRVARRAASDGAAEGAGRGRVRPGELPAARRRVRHRRERTASSSPRRVPIRIQERRRLLCSTIGQGMGVAKAAGEPASTSAPERFPEEARRLARAAGTNDPTAGSIAPPGPTGLSTRWSWRRPRQDTRSTSKGCRPGSRSRTWNSTCAARDLHPGAGESSIGVFASGSQNVVLERVTIVAGKGADEVRPGPHPVPKLLRTAAHTLPEATGSAHRRATRKKTSTGSTPGDAGGAPRPCTALVATNPATSGGQGGGPVDIPTPGAGTPSYSDAGAGAPGVTNAQQCQRRKGAEGAPKAAAMPRTPRARRARHVDFGVVSRRRAGPRASASPAPTRQAGPGRWGWRQPAGCRAGRAAAAPCGGCGGAGGQAGAGGGRLDRPALVPESTSVALAGCTSS